MLDSDLRGAMETARLCLLPLVSRECLRAPAGRCLSPVQDNSGPGKSQQPAAEGTAHIQTHFPKQMARLSFWVSRVRCAKATAGFTLSPKNSGAKDPSLLSNSDYFPKMHWGL